MRIVFLDTDVLVLDKPAGIQSEGSSDSAEHWAHENFKAKNPFPVLMHRLDKPASGLLLFARNKKALKSLQAQMESRSLGKEYVCIVSGNALSLDNEIQHFLKRDEKGWKTITTDPQDTEAKPAQLRILNRQYHPELHETLLHVQLITGRYHQIRCQLAAVGFPVLGDGLYAPEKWDAYREIALHHCVQVWMHPSEQGNKRVISVPNSSCFAVFKETCMIWLNSENSL